VRAAWQTAEDNVWHTGVPLFYLTIMQRKCIQVPEMQRKTLWAKAVQLLRLSAKTQVGITTADSVSGPGAKKTRAGKCPADSNFLGSLNGLHPLCLLGWASHKVTTKFSFGVLKRTVSNRTYEGFPCGRIIIVLAPLRLNNFSVLYKCSPFMSRARNRLAMLQGCSVL
jgi:hypothetical protein